jgi:hypothetical protein
MKRQELAGHPEFEPQKVFDLINVDRSGALDLAQLMEFLKKQYLNPEQENVEQLIFEYDGDQDKALNFEEFSQLVLPAANTGLRSIATGRRDSPYYRPHSPLPYEVISLLVRLLDKELGLHK